MNGALNFANNTWNTVGNDAKFGDRNVSGTLFISSRTSAQTALGIYHHNDCTYYTKLVSKDVQSNQTIFLPNATGELAIVKRKEISVTVAGNSYYFNILPDDILGYDFYVANVSGGNAPFFIANVEGNALSLRNIGDEEKSTTVSVIGFKL